MSGMSWRDMYEHQLAQAGIFDRKAKEARQCMGDARAARQFLEVNRLRETVQEMGRKASDARKEAGVIRQVHLTP